jgi:hypothetical protein
MKKLLFFNCILLVFSSCKKKENRYIISHIEIICPKIKDELKEKPVININLWRQSFVCYDTIPESSISATTWLEDENAIDTLMVGGIYIPKQSYKRDMTLFATYNPNQAPKKQEDLSPLFGQDVSISFKSKKLGNFEGVLQCPKPIQLIVENKLMDSLYLSKDFRIIWDKDDTNKNPVYISLLQLPNLVHDNKPDTSMAINQIHKRVDDNGLCYIKSSELQIFPEGSFIDVAIERGAYTILTTTKGEKALFNSISKSYTTSIVFKK